jgi:hypothetical protein
VWREACHERALSLSSPKTETLQTWWRTLPAGHFEHVILPLQIIKLRNCSSECINPRVAICSAVRAQVADWRTDTRIGRLDLRSPKCGVWRR